MPCVYGASGKQDWPVFPWVIFIGVLRSKDGKICGMRAICGLLQPPRSLEMAKRTNTTLAYEEFEEKATEFISLTFDYCEDQLRLLRSHHSLPKHPKSQVLPHVAMSVQQSIKAFLTIMKIPNE